MKIRALIVDDESLARKRVSHLLGEDPDVEVLAECKNGREAVEQILEKRPDLVFLDIQMPELNGFEVLETVGRENLPAVIFITAYDQYALKAFEFHAIDYLLKPFTDDRFWQSLEWTKEALRQDNARILNSRIHALLDQLQEKERYIKRFLIKMGGRIRLVPTADIDWIEASGYYACLHIGKETALLRQTMNNLAERLDPEQFVRIHRSTIIQVKTIKEIHPWFHREFVVILKDGTKLNISKSYQKKVFDVLNK